MNEKGGRRKENVIGNRREQNRAIATGMEKGRERERQKQKEVKRGGEKKSKMQEIHRRKKIDKKFMREDIFKKMKKKRRKVRNGECEELLAIIVRTNVRKIHNN